MNLQEYIANRIYELCAEKDIALNELARKSNLPNTTVKNIVYGTSRNPGIVTIKRICDGFGISLVDFFDTDIFHEKERMM